MAERHIYTRCHAESLIDAISLLSRSRCWRAPINGCLNGKTQPASLAM